MSPFFERQLQPPVPVLAGLPSRVRVLTVVSAELAAGIAPGFYLEPVPEQPRVFRFGFDVDGFSWRLSACVLLGALLRRAGYVVSVSCRGNSISAMVKL